MKNITITSDVFRSHAFGLESVASNRSWLSGLFYDLFRSAGFSIREFAPRSEGGTFDLRRYRDHRDLPSTAEGWALATSGRIPEDAERLFVDLLQSSAVIGWGLPPSIIELLNRNGVPFVDVEIDPIRFAEDLFFRMRTNRPQLASVLQSHHVPDDKLQLSVSVIRGYAARRSPSTTEPGKSLALFTGQTTVDLAIIESGKLAVPSDYIDTIRSVAQAVDIFLVKPHPAQQDFRHLNRILDEIPNAHLCGSNTYRVLSDVKLKHVVGLSSSVLSEAALFKVPTTHLIQCDRDASYLIPERARHWFRVPGSILSDRRLPKAICAQSTLERLSLLWPQGKRAKEFNLRKSLGGGWGLDEFYSGGPLSLDLPREASRAHCSQQIGPLQLGPYLTDGWSLQEDWGRWSIGRRHRIEVQLVDFDESSHISATLHMKAFVAPEAPEQRANIYVGGRLVDKLCFRWSDQEQACCVVPITSPLVTITIETPDARSPAALGLGQDDRELGVGIRSISFSSDQNAFA